MNLIMRGSGSGTVRGCNCCTLWPWPLCIEPNEFSISMQIKTPMPQCCTYTAAVISKGKAERWIDNKALKPRAQTVETWKLHGSCCTDSHSMDCTMFCGFTTSWLYGILKIMAAVSAKHNLARAQSFRNQVWKVRWHSPVRNSWWNFWRIHEKKEEEKLPYRPSLGKDCQLVLQPPFRRRGRSSVQQFWACPNLRDLI